MLFFRVFARFHPRRFVSPLPRDLCGRRLARSKIPTRSGLSTSPSPKSFPAISFADPHPLTPATSILYKNRAGRGIVVRPVRPLAATLMNLPRKCCKQKTYGIVKPFSCNTYKKPGVGAPPDPSYTWLVPDTLRGSCEVHFHRDDSC